MSKGEEMNKVLLNGKITSIRTLDKVIYVNILCHGQAGPEFIPVTIFNTKFFNRYFYKGKWISIEGHIHINAHKIGEYGKPEIIADQINFSGDAAAVDKFVEEQLEHHNNSE